MTQEVLNMLQEIVGGYKFKNLDLLQQAFVRKSYSKERGGENNEVLEFIGDKVLDLIVVKKLTALDEEGFGWMSEDEDGFDPQEDRNEYHCEFNEQKLTEIKKKLVCKEMLARCISDLAIQNHLIMGEGDVKQGMEENDSVKEDLFEAILGAIAIDSNYDMNVLEGAVDVMLDPIEKLKTEILGNEIDYVNEIREWHAEKNDGLLPAMIYTEENERAYWYKMDPAITRRNNVLGNFALDENFCCLLKMMIEGKEVKFRDFGRSKSEARNKVCALAYDYLDEHDLLRSIQDEIEEPNRNEAIGQLEILARRGYFSLPVYEFKQRHDKHGNPVWTVECYIEEKEYFFDATASSKKEAKKSAAWEMLKYVLSIEE